jgi:Uma2 family endonuclease
MTWVSAVGIGHIVMTTVTRPTFAARHEDIEHIVLHGLRWETYVALSDDLTAAGRRLRTTFDGGTFEIMTTSPRHEKIERMTGRLIEALAYEFDIAIGSLGSTTWRRKDLAMGLEPDECYYVEHEELSRRPDEIELPKSPPPDLAVEIDVHSSSLSRMSVYEAIGVPEIWRWQNQVMRFYVRGEHGRYEEADRSRAFPFLIPDELNRALGQIGQVDENGIVRAFLAGVRKLAES